MLYQFLKCALLVGFMAVPMFSFGQSLRVMTYNIRLDVASDGENAWPKRKADLVGQVKFHAPDVWGLQEGLPHQVDYLKQALPEFGAEGKAREGEGKGEASTVFYRKKRFKLLASHTFWLSPTPDTVSMGWDAACHRVCTAVLLKDRKSKQEFWVFNTHLDHMGTVARQNSAVLILEKIKTLNPKNKPVVLMGDFNATPEAAPIQTVTQTLLDSRAVSEVPPFGPSGTFNGFKFNEPVTKLIDYIFISKNTPWQVHQYAVLSDCKDLRYPSDHLPVFVEIKMKKK